MIKSLPDGAHKTPAKKGGHWNEMFELAMSGKYETKAVLAIVCRVGRITDSLAGYCLIPLNELGLREGNEKISVSRFLSGVYEAMKEPSIELSFRLVGGAGPDPAASSSGEDDSEDDLPPLPTELPPGEPEGTHAAYMNLVGTGLLSLFCVSLRQGRTTYRWPRSFGFALVFNSDLYLYAGVILR